jgi:ubiquinone/menaquinone biosynthesis C-methylase UbiE
MNIWRAEIQDLSSKSDYPLPPVKLRHRVHGAFDKESFILNGQTLSNDVERLYASAGIDLSKEFTVLDFGVGCGRVINNLSNRFGQWKFYGTDIDSELIKWCKSNLLNIDFTNNASLPPLHYSSRFFDLIYGISVFTHLDEELQHAWLSELKRVSKTGAVLILSVHGKSDVNLLSTTRQKELMDHGFLFSEGVKGRFKLDGLPDYYQTTFHTKQYIINAWSKYFRIVDYVEKGINGHQDAVVLINE